MNEGYIDIVRFKAYTEEEAELECMKYEVHIPGTDTTFYPQCCECEFEEVTIFGVNYVN